MYNEYNGSGDYQLPVCGLILACNNIFLEKLGLCHFFGKSQAFLIAIFIII